MWLVVSDRGIDSYRPIIIYLIHCELGSKLCGLSHHNTNIVKWVLNFQLLSKINTMFNGKKRKEKRNGFGKIKQKKERKKRDRKYSFMYEFQCKSEKAWKKKMEKNNAKIWFF